MFRIATIDLGSNSFHLLIVDIDNSGHYQTVLKQKQQVQLRAGMTDNNHLNIKTMRKALNCLKQFADVIASQCVNHIIAKGTYTLRKISDQGHFIRQAEMILQHKIDVLSGEDEARLIYLGATANSSNRDNPLVIDIGGGSTELIIGKGDQILRLSSLEMGCVSFQNQFFIDGQLTTKLFEEAIATAKKLLSPIIQDFQSIGWKTVLGSAGTILSIFNIVQANKKDYAHITLEDIQTLQKTLIELGHVDAIKFSGLREDREGILPGGLSILIAIFEKFDIKSMSPAHGGLREGIVIEYHNQQKP